MFRISKVTQRQKNIICAETTLGESMFFSIVFDCFVDGRRYMLLHPLRPFYGCDGDNAIAFAVTKNDGEFCIQPASDIETDRVAEQYRKKLAAGR